VAVLILAVGVGATTTVFSVANAMLFRPLNGGASPSLVRLYSRNRDGAGAYRRFSYPNFQDLRTHRELFAELAAYTYDFVGVGKGATTRRAFAAFVSSSYFPLLQVPMALGRSFTPADDRPGAPPVVVVSHGYWKETGANPAIIGSTLVVSGRTYTVIGVTPPGFTGTMAVTATPLWLLLGQTGGTVSARTPAERLADRNNHTYSVVARLTDGLTLVSAAPGLEVVSREIEQSCPAENRSQLIEARPVPRIGDSESPSSSDPFATAMIFALAMATALLLVVALNLANMLLARGSLRQKEIAVRLAVGASRWSVVRQLLTEASLLSVAGGVLGLWVAYDASRLVASTLVPLLPMFDIVFDPTPDARVLGAALAAAVLGTAVFGLGPALRLSRPDVVSVLKEQPGALPARSGAGRLIARHGLVVAQVALSLTLLTAGGLCFSGPVRASSADPGFDLDRGIVATVDGSLAGYDAPHRRAAYLHVLERLRALGGVASASLASTTPYGESSNDRGVQPAGARPGEGVVSAVYRVVGADYFRTLGVPLIAGREFTNSEEATATPVRCVIIDVELARRLWREENPLGRQIQWAEYEAGGGCCRRRGRWWVLSGASPPDCSTRHHGHMCTCRSGAAPRRR
jgi:predicted permease